MLEDRSSMPVFHRGAAGGCTGLKDLPNRAHWRGIRIVRPQRLLPNRQRGLAQRLSRRYTSPDWDKVLPGWLSTNSAFPNKAVRQLRVSCGREDRFPRVPSPDD
jgi:hypothetical protein